MLYRMITLLKMLKRNVNNITLKMLKSNVNNITLKMSKSNVNNITPLASTLQNIFLAKLHFNIQTIFNFFSKTLQ